MDLEIMLLSGRVKFEEFYKKLVETYLKPVEEIIKIRLSPSVKQSEEALKGARETIDNILRNRVRDLSTKIFPGAKVQWDDHLDTDAVYSTFPKIVVDAIDGAKALLRGEPDVTSTLGMVTDRDIPFAIVSYPFEGERIFAIEDKVYCLPFSFDFTQDIEKYRLKTHVIKSELKEINLIDRYEIKNDATRIKLDEINKKVKKYIITRGSLAKNIISVARGLADIAIHKHESKSEGIPPYDYLTPSIILTRVGGYFRDLKGNIPDGVSHISGFIAASSKETYDLLVNELNKVS